MGDDILDGRYADWIAQAHPAGVSVESRDATRSSAPLEVVSPRDGATLVIDPMRGVPSIPLRAMVSTRGVQHVRWSIDGVELPTDAWRLSEGTHHITATRTGIDSVTIVVRVQTTEP
jgi:hypothetical protein